MEVLSNAFFAALLLLLKIVICTRSSNFIVTRSDEGDEFAWSGIVACDQFSGVPHSACSSQVQKCHCDYGRTFSTEAIFPSKCQEYRTRADYRFSRMGLDGLTVSTVYLTCRQDGMCGLNSMKSNTERPLATQSNILTTGSSCSVNYVEIIHDCEPRQVPLELHVIPRDGRLYIEIQFSENLESLVEGELFQANITCNGIPGMLLFKFNGSRSLSNKGSFDGIPAYDPLHHGCLKGVVNTNVTVEDTAVTEVEGTEATDGTEASDGTEATEATEATDVTDEEDSHKLSVIMIIVGMAVAVVIIILQIICLVCLIWKRNIDNGRRDHGGGGPEGGGC